MDHTDHEYILKFFQYRFKKKIILKKNEELDLCIRKKRRKFEEKNKLNSSIDQNQEDIPKCHFFKKYF